MKRRRRNWLRRLRAWLRRNHRTPHRCTCDGGKAGFIDYGHASGCPKAPA